MFKKIVKIFQAILGVVLIGYIVVAVMNREKREISRSNETILTPVIMEQDIVSAPIEPITRGESDWICWRGIHGDGRSHVSGIKTDWSDGLTKIWRIDFLCQGKESATWSAPIVQGNRLVVCGRDDVNDMVFCLNPEDGGLIWKQAYPAKTAAVNYGAGPRATPWIDDDRVYTFGRGGDLVCWNLLNGEKIWHKNVNDEGGEEPGAGHSSSPLVTDSLIIVKGGGRALTIAYDKMNGDLIWKTGKGPAGYAAMAMMEIEGEPVVLSFHAKGLVAITLKEGKELWNVEWETRYDEKPTTPVINDNLVFITCGDGGGQLLKVSKSGAEVVWKNKIYSSHHSDPFIIDGHIYGYSGYGNQNKGVFKCIELETGIEKWSTNEMGWGTSVAIDDYLFCCDIKGNLFLIKPDPEKFVKITDLPKIWGKVRGAIWTIPVLANGKLYLRFKQSLMCFNILG